MNTVVLTCLFGISCLLIYLEATDLEAESEILSNIYANTIQNTIVRPPGKNGSGPVIAETNMYVRQISDVDEVNMEYKVQLTFRQKWHDSRLAYEDKHIKSGYIMLLNTEKVWIPDVFFSNERDGQFFNMLRPNTLMRVYPNGDIMFSIRISLKLSCKMDLKNFPLDSQTCFIILGSYGYTTEQLVFLWKSESPVQWSKDLDIPNFKFSGFLTDYCTSGTTTGQYTCLKLAITFSRQWDYYLIRVYVPLALCVLISWIPFWLDSRETAARVSIWVSVLLVMAIVAAGSQPKIPAQSFAMAIDVWCGTCWMFLFAVILEFAVIAQIAFREERNPMNAVDDGTDNNAQDSKLGKVGKWLNRYPSRVQRIDAISRMAFPAAFALFNIVYWAVYARGS